MTPMRPSQILKNTRQNRDGQSRPDFSVSDSAGSEAPSVSVSGVSAERTAHTPGDLEIFDKGPTLVLASPAAGWSVCCIVVGVDRGTSDEAIHRANAERLKLAWNAHDELLAALKSMVWEATPQSRERATAAIAKAEGRS